MKIQAALVGGVLVFLGATQGAFAETYQLELRVDASRATCAEQKTEVEQQVLQAGESLGKELKVIRVGCLQEFNTPQASGPAHRAYLFSVRYEVKGWPTVYTANWGSDLSSSVGSTSRGLFATIEQCLAARTAETEAFEKSTGLDAVFSACTPDANVGRFLLSITGFGKPKASLQVVTLEPNYWNDPGLTPEEARWVRGYLYSKRAQVRAIFGSQIVYYAAARIPLSQRNFGHWYTEEQCRVQLSDAAMMLAGMPFYFGCKTTVFDTGTSWVQLQAIMATDRLFSSDFGHMSPKYESFAACREYLPEVVAEEKATNPSYFLGALCIPEGLSSTRFVIEKWSRL